MWAGCSWGEGVHETAALRSQTDENNSIEDYIQLGLRQALFAGVLYQMLNVTLAPSPSLLWRLCGRKNQLQKVVLRAKVRQVLHSYKNLCPTWCVDLGTKMLLLGFVSEETTFLINHCSSAQ